MSELRCLPSAIAYAYAMKDANSSPGERTRLCSAQCSHAPVHVCRPVPGQQGPAPHHRLCGDALVRVVNLLIDLRQRTQGAQTHDQAEPRERGEALPRKAGAEKEVQGESPCPDRMRDKEVTAN
ncbi:hypothetical protein CEXT_394372 [Caerostris extrusa]|uniref:Uncharacterized protein n=1 Tax=Caerostris extrusa TaxID=172846 RepID=A0AAV4MJ05_CAEEX|nr:hypothetical protein CEXT_394372 [Caerostris extrusa]